MPELPEVETVRKGLEMDLKGATIKGVALRRKDLRTPFPKGFEAKLRGRAIKSIARRAKYLLFYLDSGDVLIAHLGMTGRFSIEPKSPRTFAAHDHVIFSLADTRTVIFNDARRFGLMDIVHKDQLSAHGLFKHLGPEPLEKDFSTAYLSEKLAKRKAPIKPILMDQELVVGVGNIYASEALFLAKIDPRRPAHTVAKHSSESIKAIRKVLNDAIASGGSSLRDFLHVSGETGYFQHHFNVYGRKGQPCFQCRTPIQSISQAGRSTFFCKRCQK